MHLEKTEAGECEAQCDFKTVIVALFLDAATSTTVGQGLLTKPCQSRASMHRTPALATKCPLSLPIDSPLHNVLRS